MKLLGSLEGTCNCPRCIAIREIGAFKVAQPMSLRELGLTALGCLLGCFAVFYGGLWLLDLI